MKARINFGGFAFPSVGFSSGMTLRDYFAGQVMAGMAANDASAQDRALWAYEMADAMLAARERKEDSP